VRADAAEAVVGEARGSERRAQVSAEEAGVRAEIAEMRAEAAEAALTAEAHAAEALGAARGSEARLYSNGCHSLKPIAVSARGDFGLMVPSCAQTGSVVSRRYLSTSSGVGPSTAMLLMTGLGWIRRNSRRCLQSADDTIYLARFPLVFSRHARSFVSNSVDRWGLLPPPREATTLAPHHSISFTGDPARAP